MKRPIALAEEMNGCGNGEVYARISEALLGALETEREPPEIPRQTPVRRKAPNAGSDASAPPGYPGGDGPKGSPAGPSLEVIEKGQIFRLTEFPRGSRLFIWRRAMSKEVMLGKRNQITLPREFVREGTTLFECVQREDGVIELIPLVSIPQSQAYFWTNRWQQGERAASEDIRESRLRTHSSAEALIHHVDRKRKA